MATKQIMVCLLSKGPNGTLKVFKRTPDSEGSTFDTNEKWMIWGCNTGNAKKCFEDNVCLYDGHWNVASAAYYHYGLSTSRTKVKSTDFKNLYHRPKSAGWTSAIEDVLIIVGTTLLVVASIAAIVFTLGGAVFIEGGLLSVVSLSGAAEAFIGGTIGPSLAAFGRGGCVGVISKPRSYGCQCHTICLLVQGS